MSLPRRLINLAGALLVMVVLVAGTLLFAGPVYMQSLDVVAQKLVTENSNDGLRARIAELQQQKAMLPELDKRLSRVRSEITQTARLDDISRLVVDSAKAAGVTIVKLDYIDPVPFVANTAQPTAPLGLPPVSEPVPAATSTGDSAGAGPAAPTASPTPEAGQPDTVQAQSVDPDAAITGDIQIGIAIEVRTDSIDNLPAFLDQLRKGPRLLQISKATATTNTDEKKQISLTVDAFTFVKTEPVEQQR